MPRPGGPFPCAAPDLKTAWPPFAERSAIAIPSGGAGAPMLGAPMLPVALSICSSLVYGVSDFLGGLKSRSLPLLSVLLVSQGAALVFLVAAAAVSGTGPPASNYVLYGVLAGLCEAVGLAALYRGLAVGTMSLVAPLAATAPLFPVVAAFALGEAPAPIQTVGIALALAGIAVISLEPGAERTPDLGRSVGLGMLTAAGFGGFLVAMDAASEGGVLWALLLARLTAVLAYGAAFAVVRPALGLRREELPVLVLIGLLIICADTLSRSPRRRGCSASSACSARSTPW